MQFTYTRSKTAFNDGYLFDVQYSDTPRSELLDLSRPRDRLARRSQSMRPRLASRRKRRPPLRPPQGQRALIPVRFGDAVSLKAWRHSTASIPGGSGAGRFVRLKISES